MPTKFLGMLQEGGVVAPMRGLRGDILVALKQAQPLTTKELAAQFEVTPNALRRYLKELEEAGLVRYERVARGVGGPAFAFLLTEAADELFPTDYRDTLTEALTALREHAGSDAVRDVFDRRWRDLVTRQAPALRGLPPARRGAAVAAAMSAAGYMTEWRGEVGGGTIIARHCAVRSVAERFPEACAAEMAALAETLDAVVERRSCIAVGCAACEYGVRFEADDADVNDDMTAPVAAPGESA